MTSPYYRELEWAPESHHRDGWRYLLEQAFRFEATLDVLRPGDRSVLDLGCGSAALAGWLHRSGWRGAYAGIDGRATLVETARATSPRLAGLSCELVVGDFHGAALEPADVVVAIGALVDGERHGDLERFRHLRRLLERVFSLARRGAAIWILRHEALVAKPASEPVLCGATRAELEALCGGREVSIRDDLLESEYLVLYRGPDSIRWRGCIPLIDAVCTKLGPRLAPAIARARLCLDCGQIDLAHRLLSSCGEEGLEVELLRERARLGQALRTRS